MNPFLIACISIIFGGVSTAILTHAFTAQRSYREYRLNKLEELLIALHKHRLVFIEIYEQYLAQAQGRGKFNDVLNFRDEYLKKGQLHEFPHFVMMAIAEVYFPELSEIVSQIANTLGGFSRLDNRLFAANRETPVDHYCQGEINRLSSEYDALEKDFRRKVKITSKVISNDSVFNAVRRCMQHLYTYFFRDRAGWLVVILTATYVGLTAVTNNHPSSLYIAFLVLLVFCSYLALLELLYNVIQDNKRNAPLLAAMYISVSIVYCILLSAIPGFIPLFREVPPATTPVQNDFLNSFTNAFYYTTSTFTTLGYGDFVPTNRNGKMFSCLTALSGVTHSVVFISIFISTLINKSENKRDV